LAVVTERMAYPLAWPAGRPRTPERARESARFGKRVEKYDGAARWTQFRRGVSIAEGNAELRRELERLGARSVVVSTDVPLRNDGQPRGGARPPDDPGVAVYFQLEGQELCLSCDRYDAAGDNLYAVAMTIGAMRGIERWGTGEMMRAAFRGFRSLPPASSAAWWNVLGLEPSVIDREDAIDEIEAAFKRQAKLVHPDVGGDRFAWDQLIIAKQDAMRAAGRAQ